MTPFRKFKLPKESPWGPVTKSMSPAPGIWAVDTGCLSGFCLSRQRYMAVCNTFPEFDPEDPRWWCDCDDGSVVVAAFDELFPDWVIYKAYHVLLAAAEWDKRFNSVVELVNGARFEQRAYKYAAEKKLYYIVSSSVALPDGRESVRLLRKSDGHAVRCVADPDWVKAGKFYTEAEVSMKFAKPITMDGR